MQPLVSVVIPSFNKGGFIEQTIESVIVQTYSNIELIVIDAISGDNTHSILEEYRADIECCLIEPDKGQSDAINKGVKIAKGDIVGWLNADDLLFPDAIEIIVQGFNSSPQVGVVYGSGEKVDIDGNLVKEIPHRPFDPKLLKQLFYILQPSMYFKKDLFQQVGGLNIDSNLAMDWELVLKLSKITEFLSIPDKVSKLRMYEGTKTSFGGWETYREIARIGREQNGITDLNYMSFTLRDLVTRFNVPGLQRSLRYCVDAFCQYRAGGELYMVCRWPESFQNK